MLWIITKDILDGERNPDAGACVVPTDCQHFRYIREGQDFDAWVDGLPFEFRLFDDDGEQYYEGKCDDLTNADEDNAFAPLNWATDYAGCTRMDYRKVGDDEWETL